jgi:hypothetical protein
MEAGKSTTKDGDVCFYGIAITYCMVTKIFPADQRFFNSDI